MTAQSLAAALAVVASAGRQLTLQGAAAVADTFARMGECGRTADVIAWRGSVHEALVTLIGLCPGLDAATWLESAGA